MSLLFHPAPSFALESTEKAHPGAPERAASTTIEVVRRVVKFAIALTVIALVVAAVIGVRLAIYWPHVAR